MRQEWVQTMFRNWNVLLSLAMLPLAGGIAKAQSDCFEYRERTVCDSPPPKCLKTYCSRPAPSWVMSPNNSCVLIPSFDWSRRCPAESEEPIQVDLRVELDCVVKSNHSGMGYPGIGSEPMEKICWQIRPCDRACLETSQCEGAIPNQWSGNCGFQSGNPGETKIYRARCRTGSGDARVGPPSHLWTKCEGVPRDCPEDP